MLYKNYIKLKLTLLILIFTLASSLGSLSSYAQADLQTRFDQVKSSITELESMPVKLQDEISDKQSQQTKISEEIDELNKEIDELDKQNLEEVEECTGGFFGFGGQCKKVLKRKQVCESFFWWTNCKPFFSQEQTDKQSFKQTKDEQISKLKQEVEQLNQRMSDLSQLEDKIKELESLGARIQEESQKRQEEALRAQQEAEAQAQRQRSAAQQKAAKTSTGAPAVVTPKQPQPSLPTNASSACYPSYPDVCLRFAPDLDCGDISFKNIRVIGPDIHRLDGDKDGIGCEKR